MELLQLRYFFESSKNENFTKTAEKYWVPTSSVSAAVKRLEEELGCRLFDRQNNRIILNENGKLLQSSLCAIFDELEYAVGTLKKPLAPSPEIKILLLSMRETATNVMIEFVKKNPHIHFHAIYDAEEQSPDNFDLIIDKDNGKYPEHEKVELASFQICFKAAQGSPLIGKELTMQDLRHQRFITMENDSDLSSALFQSCKSVGFYPNVVVKTNSPDCYKKCTQRELGISLWRKYSEPSKDGLISLNVIDFQMRQTMYLYYKKGITNQYLKEFIHFLKTNIS